MPLTVAEAISQITAKIQEKGKFNVGNVLDAVIGVAKDNSADLQALLDKLMNKKGVLTPDDEKTFRELMERQAIEKKKRQQIRTKNTLIIAGIGLALGTCFYFLLRKKRGSTSAKNTI